MAWPERYAAVTPMWMDSLRAVTPDSGSVDDRELYTVDDVRALLAVETSTLKGQRVKAAVAMLFLSGVRDGALVTLPVAAVDVAGLAVRQWTALGVRTKFSKSATTHLFEIEDLLEVVREWDVRVRRALDPDAMWYANLSQAPGRKHVVAVRTQSRHRAKSLRRDLRWLCARAEMDYLPPHKLRHGHIVHGLQHATTMADWKAVSQNVMHSSMAITDAQYGDLLDRDVGTRIAGLGGGGGQVDAVAELEALLARLKGG